MWFNLGSQKISWKFFKNMHAESNPLYFDVLLLSVLRSATKIVNLKFQDVFLSAKESSNWLFLKKRKKTFSCNSI